MEPRRRPVRRAALVGAALALALIGSACSSGPMAPAPAATVNGSEISRQELNDLLDGYATFVESELKAQEQQFPTMAAQGQTSMTQAEFDQRVAEQRAKFKVDPNTFPTSGAAQVLGDLIQREVYEQAVALKGGKVTAADRAKAKQKYAGDQIFTKAPKRVQNLLLDSEAARAAVERMLPKGLTQALTDAQDAYEKQLQDAYAAQKASFQQVCVRIIGTADQASAQSVADRVKGGEDFATVAADVKSDATAASTPQCFDPATIAQAFPDLTKAPAVGDVLGPLDQRTSWLVLQVDSLKQQSYSEVRDQLAQAIPDQLTASPQAALSSYVAKLLTRVSTITVDPMFGTWNEKQLEVEPPRVPTTPTTPPKATTTTTAPGGVDGTVTTEPAAAGS